MISHMWTHVRRSNASRRLFAKVELDGRFAEDPLSHPEIRAMSARELADLPFAHR